MTPFAFISYRRDDSQAAAIGLYVQLRHRIGTDRIFMDRFGIPAGTKWPDRIREAMERATVALVLIGPNWLRCADQYGRRRLDVDDDWVRAEILTAIQLNKKIIPILLGAQTDVPPAEALPEALRPLMAANAYSLRDDHWDSDLNALIRVLEDTYQFKDLERKIVLPEPVIRIAALTQDELDAELKTLPGWEPVETLVPGDYPKSRHELRKVYGFPSFHAAMRFMSTAAASIDDMQHHPRWENQWKTVTVYFSTWDIGGSISALDVKSARLLDTVFAAESATWER